ncbi:hypothetical protein ES707_08135 [subsurface metagenome]
MKTYQGKICDRGAGPQIILISDKGKSYYLKHMVRHSPDGFNWGYEGSGPADTALSILTDCLGKEQANHLYQPFKRAFVAGWGNEFSITEKEIKDWTEEQLKEPK